MSKSEFDIFMETLLPLLDKKENYLLHRNATKLSEKAKDLHSLLNNYENVLLKKEEKVEYLEMSILWTIGWISIEEENGFPEIENVIYGIASPAKMINILLKAESGIYYCPSSSCFFAMNASRKKLQSLFNKKQELELKQMNQMQDMLNL